MLIVYVLGLPNFRFKLPSRNWLIFWGIIGSWSAAYAYDRREKKKIQQKWCLLVSHLAQDPLPCKELQRKITIVLSSPPADGLMSAREHFHEYVKPVLVASGLDWDVIEGRKEGDVRAGLAEKIRKLRKRREGIEIELEPGDEDEAAIYEYRQKVGVYPAEGVAGDIVIGRNTWKEYIRGVHEGWLGPLDMPPELREQKPEASTSTESAVATSNGSATPTNPPSADETTQSSSEPSATFNDDQAAEDKPVDKPEEKTEEKQEEKPEKKKRKQPPPFIPTSAYASASAPSYMPSELGPCAIVEFPHILGFFNTPIRMKRFLNRRYLADDIGREVAAAVFAVHRPFDQIYGPSTVADDSSPTNPTTSDSMGWEQQNILKHEEKQWHKSIRKDREEGKESVWLDEPVFDERIAGRMRRFILEPDQESRAQRIKQGKEGAIDKFKDNDDLN